MTMASTSGKESDLLIVAESATTEVRRRKSRESWVVPTSTTRAPTTPRFTVEALLDSTSVEEREVGDEFLRRTFALLFLQYGLALLLASPFTLLPSFRERVKPYHNVLEVVSTAGIVGSMALALTKGTIYPYAHVSLGFITCFVGLELGLTFAQYSWGTNGLIALGQATVNFGVLLSVLQFPLKESLTYFSGSALCFVVSGLWAVVLYMVGDNSLLVSLYVSLGGWAFLLMVLLAKAHIVKHVAPEEYILAVLFILVPEALMCLSSKERHPKEEKEEGEGGEDVESSSAEPLSSATKYGALDPK